MASSGVKMNLKGWKQYLDQLQVAGKDIDKEAEKCIKKSAEITEKVMREEAATAGVPGDLVQEISTEITHNGNSYSADIGWKKGEYNPRKLSTGYKIIFMNYGTAKRHTRLNRNRGKITAMGFVERANKKANTKVKKEQKEALKDMLKGLQ